MLRTGQDDVSKKGKTKISERVSNVRARVRVWIKVRVVRVNVRAVGPLKGVCYIQQQTRSRRGHSWNTHTIN